MAGLVIRPEHAGDAPAVREVNDRAFGGILEGRIVDALRASGEMISLVATLDERVVGHIAFTPVTGEPPAPSLRIAGLAPMAVHPEFQRRGIGGALIRAGLAECRRHQYTAVVVVGHPQYYPRFGFVPGHTLGLRYEDFVPPEAFMVLELTPAAVSGAPARVRYRPEFTETA